MSAGADLERYSWLRGTLGMMLHVSARAVTWRGTLGMMLHVSARADLERYSWHDVTCEC